MTQDQKDRLALVCRKFFDRHEITCGETIYQDDSVALDSLEFIAEIASVIGCSQPQDYHEDS